MKALMRPVFPVIVTKVWALRVPNCVIFACSASTTLADNTFIIFTRVCCDSVFTAASWYIIVTSAVYRNNTARFVICRNKGLSTLPAECKHRDLRIDQHKYVIRLRGESRDGDVIELCAYLHRPIIAWNRYRFHRWLFSGKRTAYDILAYLACDDNLESICKRMRLERYA